MRWCVWAAWAMLCLGSAQAQTHPEVDIAGRVTGPNGPEAGVWVIAETTELPTRYIKIVVTDDQGRYVLPAMPQADYSVWVRGYGLVDSPKQRAIPGQHVNLDAVPAPTPKAAAHYYPAIYWYSLLKMPDAAQFGGKGDIPAGITQIDWITTFKNRDCVGCHQQGQESTRLLPAAFAHEGSTAAGWARRIQSGQSAPLMIEPLAGKLGGVPFSYLADYTDAITNGALPRTTPPRPQGVERNLVITMWGWGSDHTYLHDGISTDRRNPTVNANGPIWGSPEYSTDLLPVLDPGTNTATQFQPPAGAAGMPESLGPGHAATLEPVAPSAYWGDAKIWTNRINNHNSMFDQDGRLWLTAGGRGFDNPAVCRQGSEHPSARAFPLDGSRRQLALYDPASRQFSYVDTCFGAQHLMFGYDADNTLWLSGGGPVIGWLNTRKYLETHDAYASQGWVSIAAITPDKQSAGAGTYAIMPARDGSVWATMNVPRGTPGILRLEPGANPPATARAEFYKVPLPGFAPRGGDVDSQGVVWTSLASGHLGRFDRRLCKGPLDQGPGPSGILCPEGWSFFQYPGPGFDGIGPNSAEASYYTWVDQHNTLGLGKDVPISTGNENDALLAFVDGRFVVLRVPYPLSFYAKGLDGRIDDAAGGWQGRGVWTTNGDRTPWLKEGGKGTTPLAMHFQIRPDPLAD